MDNLRYLARSFRIPAMRTPYNGSMRAKLHSLFHRHGRMNAKFAGFVTARCHYPPIRRTANKHRFAKQRRVELTLNRYEERIKIDMDDMAFSRHSTNVKKDLLFAKFISNIVCEWSNNCVSSALDGVVTNKYRMHLCLQDAATLFNIFRIVTAWRFVSDNTNKGKINYKKKLL